MSLKVYFEKKSADYNQSMKNYPACNKLNEVLPMLFAIISTKALAYKENKNFFSYLWLEKSPNLAKNNTIQHAFPLNNRVSRLLFFLSNQVFHVVFHWKHLDKMFPMRRHNKCLQWKIRNYGYLVDKNLILDPRPWKQQHSSATLLLET